MNRHYKHDWPSTLLLDKFLYSCGVVNGWLLLLLWWHWERYSDCRSIILIPILWAALKTKIKLDILKVALWLFNLTQSDGFIASVSQSFCHAVQIHKLTKKIVIGFDVLDDFAPGTIDEKTTTRFRANFIKWNNSIWLVAPIHAMASQLS